MKKNGSFPVIVSYRNFSCEQYVHIANIYRYIISCQFNSVFV